MSDFPPLDIRTVGSLFALNSVAIAAAIFLSAKNYPKSIAQSLMVFASGKMLFAGGFVLIGFRSFLPVTFTVLVANVLGVAGVYINYMAVRIILGRSPHVAVMALVCSVVAAGALYFITYVGDFRGARIIASLSMGAITAVTANELLRRCQHSGNARVVGGWLALLMSMTFTMRAVVTFQDPPYPPSGGYVGGNFEIFFLLVSFFSAALGAVNLVLLSNDLFNEELLELTRTDALTGVANRRRLAERGTEEWHRSRRFGTPMAVIAVDLDHFKRINDTYGHATGDMVLRAAAQAFAAEIRDVDFIARAGGEEFVVILAGAEIVVAEVIAERLRRTMESLCLYSPADEPMTVTISLGLAVLGADESFEALWERADVALYQAKNDGRNRVALAA